jgi:Domain of unknown function (DUF4258)
MSRDAALRIIRERAADSANVVLLSHAKAQMKKRRINAKQIISCLQKGVIREGPALDDKGYWRCRVARLAAGEEIVVIVSFLQPQENILVISAFER